MKLVSRAVKNTAIVHTVQKSECYIQSQSTVVLYTSLTDVAYIPRHFCQRNVLKFDSFVTCPLVSRSLSPCLHQLCTSMSFC